MNATERQHREDLKLVTRMARAHANGHEHAHDICNACERIEATLKARKPAAAKATLPPRAAMSANDCLAQILAIQTQP